VRASCDRDSRKGIGQARIVQAPTRARSGKAQSFARENAPLACGPTAKTCLCAGIGSHPKLAFWRITADSSFH